MLRFEYLYLVCIAEGILLTPSGAYYFKVAATLVSHVSLSLKQT